MGLMSRPEHLNCPNTPEGIRRINEEQAAYDKDPERWERIELERKEEREREQFDRDSQRFDIPFEDE
jgi:hypothetical protein